MVLILVEYFNGIHLPGADISWAVHFLFLKFEKFHLKSRTPMGVSFFFSLKSGGLFCSKLNSEEGPTRQ